MQNSLPNISTQLLSDSFTADQVIGNRVKAKKQVTLHEGYPESGITRSWPEGKLSPLVESYIIRDGALWWMFGEEQPVLYLKHDSSSLELVPDAGAGFLNKDKPGSTFGFPQLEGIEDLLKKAALVAGVGAGAYLLFPLLPVFRTGTKLIAKKFQTE